MNHTVLNLALVFLTRHWLPAIFNAVCTAWLGLGLLCLVRTWQSLGLTPLQFVRLRRIVFLAALCKGGLCLLTGVSRRGSSHQSLMLGVQIPDPLDLFGLFYSRDSIWYPTSATKAVSLLLVGAATCYFLWRVVQISRSRNTLNTLVSLGNPPPPAITAILERAASAQRMASASLPTLVLVDLPYPTPLLVGLYHPYLILAPQLALTLTENELEMAFRHELAHLRRRDHWWRWLFTWIEDIGQLTLISAYLATLAVEEEEDLCDRLSVRTSEEAVFLARAIQKSIALYQEQTKVRLRDARTARNPSPSHILSSLPFCFSPGHSFLRERPSTTDVTWGVDRQADIERCKIRLTGGKRISEAKHTPSRETPLPNTTASETSLSNQNESGQNQDVSSIQGGIPLPSAVIPALLGSYRLRWNGASSRQRRLRRLLRLAQELSSQQQAPPEAFLLFQDPMTPPQMTPRKQTVGRFAAQCGFCVLLFLLLYTKFYLALTLAFIHP